MAQPPLPPESRWYGRLSRSSYFFSALLLHLIIFLMVATWIIWPAPPKQAEDIVAYLPTAPKPPSPPPKPADVTFKPNDVSSQAQDMAVISTSGAAEINLKFTPNFLTDPTGGAAPRIMDIAPRAQSPSSNWDARRPEIEKTALMYHKLDDSGKTRDFPVYVASYADGDWNCNLHLDREGNIVAGSMPDLVAKIKEWSHNDVKPFVVPKPLNIASSELLDKRPPFIFFTGHKDFRLTQEEVENLRAYLQVGGAIWGDNALPGTGSRFDVAFKREMKRVVPDEDKQFVPFTMQHEVFNNRNRISQVPQGMNYYAETPSHLDIDGIPAIIYTPNDYSDLMFLRALPGDKEVYLNREPPPGTLYTQLGFWENQQVYYRNFNLESSTQAHRFGMNIVTYFIFRFDKLLLLK